MSVELSIVVPVYNEEAVLPLFVARLRPLLDRLDVVYEVVTVDDGSRDLTAATLQGLMRSWPQLRVVRLRSNAGHQAAISAGLVAARGNWVVTIDADLQDPPEVIAEMLEVGRRERVDVIYGVRTDRSTDTAFKRGSARLFYTTMRRLSGVDAPVDAGDFRMMSRATVDAINALPIHGRVIRLAVPTFGFPSASVGYRREGRAAGSSKYPLIKMLRLTADSIFGFSQAPLRFATWFGLGGFVLAFAMLIYAIVQKLSGNTVSGWPSTVVIVAGFAGIQLLCLGILGEYVGRIHSGLQGRPTYYVAYDSLEEAVTPGNSTDVDISLPLRGTSS